MNCIALTQAHISFVLNGRLGTDSRNRKTPGRAITAPPGAGTNDLMIIGSAKMD